MSRLILENSSTYPMTFHFGRIRKKILFRISTFLCVFFLYELNRISLDILFGSLHWTVFCCSGDIYSMYRRGLIVKFRPWNIYLSCGLISHQSLLFGIIIFSPTSISFEESQTCHIRRKFGALIHPTIRQLDQDVVHRILKVA